MMQPPRHPAVPAVPPSPTLVPSPLANPAPPANVTVGNATLAAQRSTNPPKFSCVLITGISGAGKTTVGRQLVRDLNEDRLGWEFFSGGDYLQDSVASRPAPWDNTKTVFDALNDTLDKLLKRQATTPIRGLLIDKQLRGIEDLYYLTNLLRSKGLLLWGIIGMDIQNDDILCSRLGGESGVKEKIKYHRVIYSRIQDAARSVNLWRSVDASGTTQDTTKSLRTMVLGCSSQSPTKQFQASAYHDSTCPLTDNYATYVATMTTLFSLVPKIGKAASFPGFTSYTPLPSTALDLRKGTALKDYVARRKLDGTKYVLIFDGTKLYLIPRHMRCVFEVPNDAWLGIPLVNSGKFVLDGELVKTIKDRSKEKFVVYDVLYWAEKGSATNTILRSKWKERQEKLKVNLCAENSAFFPKKIDVVVVLQLMIEDLRQLPTLFEPCDYPSDGIVLQPTSLTVNEATYVWRPVESVTVDFRLGTMTTKEDGAKQFVLEVFDQKAARYTQYRSDTVTIAGSRPGAIEGAIVTCGLEQSSDQQWHWHFHRLRSDLQIAAFKAHVDDLLQNCIIPKSAILEFATALESRNSHAPSTQRQPQLGGQAQPAPPTTTPTAPSTTSSHAVPAADTKVSSRGAFGSALGTTLQPPAATSGTAPATAPASQPTMKDVLTGGKRRNEELMTDAQKLSAVVGNVKVKALENSNPMQALTQMLGEKVKHEQEGTKQEKETEKECSECHSVAEGRVDKRNGAFYCYKCWAKEGVDFCEECEDFASGRHESGSRRRGAFYCDACWSKYDKQARPQRRRKESPAPETTS